MDALSSSKQKRTTNKTNEPQPTWLFKIISPDKNTSAFILGSLHTYPYDLLPEAVIRCIKKSKMLIEESNGEDYSSIGKKLVPKFKNLGLCDENAWQEFYKEVGFSFNISLKHFGIDHTQVHPSALLKIIELTEKPNFLGYRQGKGMDSAIGKLPHWGKKQVLENKSHNADQVLPIFENLAKETKEYTVQAFNEKLKVLLEAIKFFYTLIESNGQESAELLSNLIKEISIDQPDITLQYTNWSKQKTLEENLTHLLGEKNFQRHLIASQYATISQKLYKEGNIKKKMLSKYEKELIATAKLASKEEKPLVLEKSRFVSLRNEKWYPIIESLIKKEKEILFVVGNAHLHPIGLNPEDKEGDKGLLLYLAEKGYTIKRLKTDGNFEVYDPHELSLAFIEKIKPRLDTIFKNKTK